MIRALRTPLLTLAALGLATEAAALSCLMPDPARAFQEASDSPQPYVVLHGDLVFDATAMPGAVNDTDQPEAPAPVTAQFEGQVLTEQGFTQAYRGPVTLQPVCAGPWCGQLSSPAEVLAFAVNDPAGPVLVLSPCPSRVFENPSREALVRMVSCMQGTGCAPLTE